MELMKRLRALLADRSPEGRFRLILAILALVLVVGAIIAAVSALWATGKPPIQAAIVGGVFTIIAAIGGVIVVFIQLGKQAENAIKANRHNEMMKLKKDVYEAAHPIVAKASEAQSAFDWCIRQFLLDIRYIRQVQQWIPKTDGPALVKSMEGCFDATRAAAALTDKWRIIDPRMVVIKVGLLSALKDVGEAYAEYSNFALNFMAIEGGEPRISATSPDADEHARLDSLTDTVTAAIETLHNYTYDFEIELQGTLLGELFERTLVGRISRGPDDKVLRLDDELELRRYFLEETSWGRSMPQRIPPIPSSESRTLR